MTTAIPTAGSGSPPSASVEIVGTPYDVQLMKYVSLGWKHTSCVDLFSTGMLFRARVSSAKSMYGVMSVPILVERRVKTSHYGENAARSRPEMSPAVGNHRRFSAKWGRVYRRFSQRLPASRVVHTTTGVGIVGDAAFGWALFRISSRNEDMDIFRAR